MSGLLQKQCKLSSGKQGPACMSLYGQLMEKQFKQRESLVERHEPECLQEVEKLSK
ncbi:hypothetical protein EDD11_004896 [Mortierella claussenii]|nr:hypothetical protein EDD11_004896 [Mortierella claussenii]